MLKIHFIGIGGTGMSAIALLLLEKGYQVSGSDMNASRYFDKVGQAGAKTALGHSPELACSADIVLRSSAVRDNDPEVLAAQAAGIPVLKRADFLQQLIGDQKTLSVAGSHGKTSTTGMLITLLDGLNLDPSFILGAEIKALERNSRLGKGDYFVIEADEYDYMFLGLKPSVSVITNIEHDHPDCFPTADAYIEAFASFIARTEPDGSVLVCGDDHGVQLLLERLPEAHAPIHSYGFSASNTYQVSDWIWNGSAYHFTLCFNGTDLGHFTLGMPGKHNLLNATAALAVLHQLGLPLGKAAQGLAAFAGTERRFDIVSAQNGLVLINDYGHHPTQIKATLSAARELYPDKTLWAVWEPHTYSRTQAMRTEFIESLKLADRVLITSIYAAREDDPGLTPQSIADALADQNGLYIPDTLSLVDYLLANPLNNDVVVVLSAGKGPQLSTLLMQKLAARKGQR